ncbi:hypothetical protein C8J56DRAFT_935694 [Mycena floridula]|nr:hypothetical protein C8J56DRAFT_935694 [Mycena floridula]
MSSSSFSDEELPPVGDDSEEEEEEEEEIDIDQRHRNLIAMYKPLAENILRCNLAREAAQQATIAAAQAAAAEKHKDDMALATTEQAILADRLKVLQLEETLQKNRHAEMDMETLRERFLQLESDPDILDRKIKILVLENRRLDSERRTKSLDIELSCHIKSRN